ncbi:MAG: DUF2062 domain-containing protein [Phycisphaerales bacterium]|nr:MAG: DUF2062 domain-containing protein [Phycisphaerales bacterium]
MTGEEAREDIRPLIAIPTFNNRDTVPQVVKEAWKTGLPVLVVNDGSTDGGPDLLAGLPIDRIDLTVNQGKGAAISAAGRWADEHGFTHIIALDADGQHDPGDVSRFVERIHTNPLAIIVGRRDLSGPDVPRSSRFGRAFSNFWLRVACGASNPDSQSGFRAYPVEILRKVKCSTRRYDFEVEILVRSVWAGASLDTVDISVHYDDRTNQESHFRMFWDNARISLLNTRLVGRNLVPWPHRLLIADPVNGANRLSLRDWRRSLMILFSEGSSPRALAAAAALGIFLGTLPLIACHSVVIVFCAMRLRLNRLLALNVSHLCAPPFVPALAIEVGFFVRNGRWLTEFSMQTLGRELHHRLLDYLLGSLIVGPILALVAGAVVFVHAWLYQRFIARRGGAPHG